MLRHSGAPVKPGQQAAGPSGRHQEPPQGYDRSQAKSVVSSARTASGMIVMCR
jgi:hypothetical protein